MNKTTKNVTKNKEKGILVGMPFIVFIYGRCTQIVKPFYVYSSPNFANWFQFANIDEYTSLILESNSPVVVIPVDSFSPIPGFATLQSISTALITLPNDKSILVILSPDSVCKPPITIGFAPNFNLSFVFLIFLRVILLSVYIAIIFYFIFLFYCYYYVCI